MGAVPLSEESLRSNMRAVLQERLGKSFPVYSSEELFPFVYASGCSEYSEHDIISTAEQEVCFRSSIFLRSTPSSWSRNVFVDRLVHPEYKKDALRDDLLLDVLFSQNSNKKTYKWYSKRWAGIFMTSAAKIKIK